MGKQKPMTPYERLRRECVSWAFSVVFPKQRAMFILPKGRLREGWSLDDVAERVAAAKTLGWRVEMVVADNGDLRMEYVKQPEGAPLAIRP